MTCAGPVSLVNGRSVTTVFMKFMTTTPTGLESRNAPVGTGSGSGASTTSPNASGLVSHVSVWLEGAQSSMSVYRRETTPAAGETTIVPLGSVMLPGPVSW
jgi:hypothetical protein